MIRNQSIYIGPTYCYLELILVGVIIRNGLGESKKDAFLGR